MWRFTLSFTFTGLAVAFFWLLASRDDGFLEDLAMLGGVVILMLWLGSDLFFRGLGYDGKDAQKMNQFLDCHPRWRRRLSVVGALTGFVVGVATCYTLTLTPLFTPFVIPLVAFIVVLHALQIMAKKDAKRREWISSSES